MKLYYWSSSYLKDYSNGYIVVMASSVAEAREKAMAAFDAHYRERFGYRDMPGTPDANEDDIAHYNECRGLLVEDLAAEPKELTDGLIFVPGSE